MKHEHGLLNICRTQQPAQANADTAHEKIHKQKPVSWIVTHSKEIIKILKKR